MTDSLATNRIIWLFPINIGSSPSFVNFLNCLYLCSVFIKVYYQSPNLPFIFCQNPTNLPFRIIKSNRICPFRSWGGSEYLSWSLCSVSFLLENSGSVTYHSETLVWVLFVVYFWYSLILHVYGSFPSFFWEHMGYLKFPACKNRHSVY